jgi:hypothetical protein
MKTYHIPWVMWIQMRPHIPFFKMMFAKKRAIHQRYEEMFKVRYRGRREDERVKARIEKAWSDEFDAYARANVKPSELYKSPEDRLFFMWCNWTSARRLSL